MNPALLDSDMVSEILKLRNPLVAQRALDYERTVGPLCFSAVTRYEIRRGLKHKKAHRLLVKFESFCKSGLVLPVDDAVFERAEDLWVIARTGGFPHNDADLLIAATALNQGRELVTGNTPHFAWIPGLTLIDWRQP